MEEPLGITMNRTSATESKEDVKSVEGPFHSAQMLIGLVLGAGLGYLAGRAVIEILHHPRTSEDHQESSPEITERQLSDQASLSPTPRMLQEPPKIRWGKKKEVGPETCNIYELFPKTKTLSVSPRQREPIVVLSQQALARFVSHLDGETRVEQGGLFVGHVYQDQDNKVFCTVIRDAIPCDGHGTPVHFEFTADAWQNASTDIAKAASNGNIVVGWYHSHPGLGVFLSGTDLRSQAQFFSNDWNIAVVRDPKKNVTGFFWGPEGQSCTLSPILTN